MEIKLIKIKNPVVFRIVCIILYLIFILPILIAGYICKLIDKLSILIIEYIYKLIDEALE